MFEIKLPGQMTLVQLKDKVRFRGTAQEIVELSKAIRKIGKLPLGGFGRIEKQELTVMNQPSQYEHRIALPAHAWNIMASLFQDVAFGLEDSPLDFNDYGYLYPPLKKDLGVEMVGNPLSAGVSLSSQDVESKG